MSRKVTINAINSFLNKTAGSFGNTLVTIENEVVKLFLHRNMIAKLENGELFITNSGWFSNTTKERLNGLPNVSIYQRKGIWYLNGNEWNGKLTKI